MQEKVDRAHRWGVTINSYPQDKTQSAKLLMWASGALPETDPTLPQLTPRSGLQQPCHNTVLPCPGKDQPGEKDRPNINEGFRPGGIHGPPLTHTPEAHGSRPQPSDWHAGWQDVRPLGPELRVHISLASSRCPGARWVRAQELPEESRWWLF